MGEGCPKGGVRVALGEGTAARDRLWEAVPAELDANGRASATLPAGTTVYYLNLIDESGLVVSSEHVEVTE